MSHFKSISLPLQEKSLHRFGAREVHKTFCKLKLHEIHASSFIHKIFCNRVQNTVSVKQYSRVKSTWKEALLGEREINWTSSWTAVQVLNKCFSVQVLQKSHSKFWNIQNNDLTEQAFYSYLNSMLFCYKQLSWPTPCVLVPHPCNIICLKRLNLALVLKPKWVTE